MVNPAEIIHLSKQAFWDVDMDKLDQGKNANYIITKVFDSGSLQDVMEIIDWYGDDKSCRGFSGCTIAERDNDGICI